MKRHPVELLSLVSGIVFVVFALIYLMGAGLDFTPASSVTLPLLIVGLGGAGIASAISAQRRMDTGSADADPVDAGLVEAEPVHTDAGSHEIAAEPTDIETLGSQTEPERYPQV